MKQIKNHLYYIPLFIISFTSIIPFYFIVSMATHTTSEIYRVDVFSFGSALKENLSTIIEKGFLTYYWNTIFVSVLSATFAVTVSAMAAYALTVYDFKLRTKIQAFIITSMMVPGQIGLIGYTIEMKTFGFINTHIPLILIWCASAYSAFFMIQYMKGSLPKELIESARIDGSGEFGTFIKIAVPLVKPAIGTLFMLIFLWSWNNYMMPSTVLTQNSKFTLPLGIQSLSSAYNEDWGAKSAALAISVMPMLVVFSFGSKYFIKGLAAGAVKG